MALAVGPNGKMDLVFDTTGANKGNPRCDSTRTFAVLTTLMSWKRGRRVGSSVDEGGWIWDPEGTRGTLLWTVGHDRLSTPSQLRAYAEDGAQQLQRLGFVQTWETEPVRRAPGKWLLNVRWTVPSGLSGSARVTF